ncbi:hypothetical protein, partial [Acinetobacter johnsonii]|uniref:hypothetical protein n=1 Tax=Acinetobacter johnsonii TaxID=40214 RepID=UPI00244C96F8
RLYRLQNSKAVRLPCKIRRINAAFIHPAEGFNLSAVIKILAKCFENNFNKTIDYRFNTHFFTSWVLYFFRLWLEETALFRLNCASLMLLLDVYD